MSAESSHYYYKSGKACHTLPTKKGAKNRTRPTRIDDAIKLGLLPSVTGVASVLSSEQLQRWRERKIIEACFDASPGPDESLEEYSEFIIEQAFSRVKQAQDVGTKGHAILDDVFNGKEYDRDEAIVFPTTGEAVPAHIVIEPVRKAIGELGLTVKETECIVVNLEHGFGGTLDAAWIAADMSAFGCWDYKFCKTTPGKPVKPKETQPMQLAAYVQTYWGGISERARAFNAYISTTEPGRVELVHYDSGRLSREWEAFKHVLAIWRHRFGYDPRERKAA